MSQHVGTHASLRKKILLAYIGAVPVLALLLFIPAGTTAYWQGWVYMAVLYVPALFAILYFLKRRPEFLERRMQFREKESRQKLIIKIFTPVVFLGFVIAGLDHRFGWSAVPMWLVLVSDVVVLAGYAVIFLTFKENPFAARTIEVFEDQYVVETGPYAIVRHPMYAGSIPLYLCTPLALGSFWALAAFLPVCAVFIPRILNEETILKRDLPGYSAYCEKVRYRLLPFVW